MSDVFQGVVINELKLQTDSCFPQEGHKFISKCESLISELFETVISSNWNQQLFSKVNFLFIFPYFLFFSIGRSTKSDSVL